MAAIPEPAESIVDKIYAAIEREENRELYLARLGASSIGDKCLRAIWLSWRAFDDATFGGRMLRLFKTGDIQEERIVEDLRRAGFAVWDKDENGKQFSYTDPTGHFVVKLDGVIKGVPGAEKTPHVLEIKSHSKKSFEELEKKGVQKSKPAHYYQMQSGMKYSGLKRGLYVAVCKDNEQYYVERLREDIDVQNDIEARINTLVGATMAPAGISHDGTAWDCTYCDMRKVCIHDKAPMSTCRSCEYVEVHWTEGRWVCSLTQEILSIERQKLGCEHYKVM